MNIMPGLDVAAIADLTFSVFAVIFAICTMRREAVILAIFLSVESALAYWISDASFYIIHPSVKGWIVYPLIFVTGLTLSGLITVAVGGCLASVLGYALCIGVVIVDAMLDFSNITRPDNIYPTFIWASYAFMLWGCNFGNNNNSGRYSRAVDFMFSHVGYKG